MHLHCSSASAQSGNAKAGFGAERRLNLGWSGGRIDERQTITGISQEIGSRGDYFCD